MPLSRFQKPGLCTSRILLSPLRWSWAVAQACPHKSVEFRLRIPGSDLWSGHVPRPAEVSLLFMLLGAGAPAVAAFVIACT